MKKKFDMIKTENTVISDVSSAITETELSRPQNMPEISRLITVSGRNIITLTQSKEDRIILEGKTCFTVCYMDMKGECHSFEAAAAFEHEIKAHGVSEECITSVVSKIKDIETRLLPQGLVWVKATNIFSYTVNKVCEYTPEIISESDENDIFIKKQNISMPVKTAVKSGLFSKREDIRLPQNLPTIKKILDIRGYVAVKNINVESMRISVEGDIHIDVLYESSDKNAPIMHYMCALPFGEIIDDAEIMSGDKACAFADIMDIDAASFEGSEDIITAEVSYKLKCDIYRNVSYDVVSDVYSRKTDMEITKENVNTLGLKDQIYAKSILRSSAVLNENAPDISRVLYTLPQVHVEKEEIQNGFARVEGSITTKICYSCLNGSIYTASVKTPFLQEIACDVENAALIKAQCDIEYFEVEGSGREADVKFALETSLKIYFGACLDIVLVAQDKKDSEIKRRGLLVYTLEKDLSAWDVCKRFHVSFDELSHMNPHIESGAVKKGEKLIIFP